MLIDLDLVGKKLYKVYCGLRNGGFTDGHALGIISNTLGHLITQDILREEAEAKRILEK